MSPSEHEEGAGQEPQHGLPLIAHMETKALEASQWSLVSSYTVLFSTNHHYSHPVCKIISP